MKSLSKSILVSIASVVVWLVAPSLAAAQTMRAHFLDVGQGSAAILEFPCAAMLVATGGESNDQFESTASLLDQIEDFFVGRPDLNGTFHSMILTHPHIDHSRGVKAVLEHYKVLNAVTNGHEDPTDSGAAGQKALHKKVADSEQTGNSHDIIGFEPVRVSDIPAGQGLTNEIVDPVKCDTVDPKITALWGFAGQRPGWTQTDVGQQNNHSVVLRRPRRS